MANLLKIIGIIVLMTQGTYADEVARWVDDDGVTHFGNPQFAPSFDAERVELAPANAMDAPDVKAAIGNSRRGAGPNVHVLSRGVKKNPRGWRGYAGRAAHSTERTTSGGRR